MNFTKNFGNDGEVLAKKFLKLRGLEILVQNFHTREGEVDLIAKEGDQIVFVEVKARRNAKFGTALESVDESKLEKIEAVGHKFLQENFLENAGWRIDLIVIEDGKLKWIKGV